MSENSEQHWSCGCIKIDGALARECTQTPHVGEMKAHEAAIAKPYSQICFRKRAEANSITIPASAGEEASNGVQE